MTAPTAALRPSSTQTLRSVEGVEGCEYREGTNYMPCGVSAMRSRRSPVPGDSLRGIWTILHVAGEKQGWDAGRVSEELRWKGVSLEAEVDSGRMRHDTW